MSGPARPAEQPESSAESRSAGRGALALIQELLGPARAEAATSARPDAGGGAARIDVYA